MLDIMKVNSLQKTFWLSILQKNSLVLQSFYQKKVQIRFIIYKHGKEERSYC